VPLTVRALLFLLPLIMAAMVAFHIAGDWPIQSRERLKIFAIWIIVTLFAFLVPNYWIFAAMTIGILFAAAPREPSGRVVFFIVLLVTLPLLVKELPGFGPIRYLIDLSYPRMCIIGLLMPLMFFPPSRFGKRMALFTSPVDKYVILFLGVDIAVSSRGLGSTEVVRMATIYFIDFFAVYFVISRHITSFEQLAKCMAAIVLGAVVIATTTLIESAKEWKMYHSMFWQLDLIVGPLGNWHEWRGGLLRTSGTMGIPIVLGCYFTYAIGALMATRHHLRSSIFFWGIAGLLVVANFLTVSRGAWIGLAVLIVVYLFFTSRAKLVAGGVLGMLVIAFASTSSHPMIQSFYELLPFTGGGHDHTINYRKLLLENAIDVMRANPWLGAADYLSNSAMEDMRQGQGIIDIVNSYIQLGLRGGLLLVGCFSLLFFYLLLRMTMILRNLQDPDRGIGVALIAMLMAHLVMIFTVSLVTYLPYLQWILIGMSGAFVHIHLQRLSETRAGAGAHPQHGQGPAQGPGHQPGQGHPALQ